MLFNVLHLNNAALSLELKIIQYMMPFKDSNIFTSYYIQQMNEAYLID